MAAGIGALYLGAGRTLFRVWAPAFEALQVVLLSDDGERSLPLQRDARGYHEALVEETSAGTHYWFVAPGGERMADPASRHQPEGVHGPSAVVDLNFEWTTEFVAPPLADTVLYELHVGTFTRTGTFDAAIEKLDYLKELGVNAVEVMPISQFPGERNWGYDGVFPFAVQNSYGGPAGFARFVDACHLRGLAVALDVVYNHLGPEGNLLGRYGPYFNARYRTPWGDAINFDGEHSDEVRRYFLEQARQFVFDYRVDLLRLDAVHAILDTSAYPFLSELADLIHGEAHDRSRVVHVIAESDLNDPRMIRPREQGGHGMDGQWLDDFHHSVHALCTGEKQGYYADFGDLQALARCYRDAYVYSGQYSAFRRRRHGAAAPDARPEQFVVCIQNHDQVGNRMMGERLTALTNLAAHKTAAAALLCSPYVPLLFMGEEYGEPAPFPYFVSHTDPQLIEAVRQGRKTEFSSFSWQGEPPDPQAEATFESAVLNWGIEQRSPHRELLSYYRKLLELRRELRFGHAARDDIEVITFDEERTLLLLYREPTRTLAMLLGFNSESVVLELPLAAGVWDVLLDSTHRCWGGPADGTASTIESVGLVRRTVPAWSALLLEQSVAA